ncbi:MAG: tRNA (adenosine(37)-N6)-threonylcarbamoyltransferase complex transferase subunit TsaD [Minisyncoccia bacterium]|jgi:N6-L-threonylcarbamoyladenine synthase
MLILGIETSCDETSIALLKADKKRANFFITPIKSIVSSQIKIHAPYGGVVPMLASREHVKNLDVIFNQVLKESEKEKQEGGIKNIISKIDLIAVTRGPGLIPALLVGINFSKTLAWSLKKKIIGVNHLEAHFLSFLLPNEGERMVITQKDLKRIFPAIGLIVSGGHTLLIYAKNINDYMIIGETRDDAAGECFDKTSRILGLGYPGGPAISKEAEKGRIQNAEYKIQKLPRPMIDSQNFDFSFSGLKTAVLYAYKKIPPQLKRGVKKYFAKEIEDAITDVLVKKTILAAQKYQAKTIILGGGVTANKVLREKISKAAQENNLNLYLPLLQYTTDNAMMVALTGFFDFLNKKQNNYSWENLEADANLII